MKYFGIPFCICLLISLLSPVKNALAHPGIGIVKDSKGNIYYTDLKQIWKINKSGERKVVVSSVHSHELYIDANDNLYGEHLWYNGERLNTWGHYVWRLNSNETVVKEVEPTEGLLTNYSFVRDSAGNMYWIERFTTSRFMKKTPDGKITRLAEGKFGSIGWLYSTKAGTIYFIEDGKLQKLTPDGKIALITQGIAGKTTDMTMMGKGYDGYGIWTDADDNIYIAMTDSKKVNRISPEGKVTTMLHSNSQWTICNGVFDNDGNLWVLEYSKTNEVRIRKIDKYDTSNATGQSKPFIGRASLMVAGVLLIIVMIVWLLFRSKTRLTIQPLRS